MKKIYPPKKNLLFSFSKNSKVSCFLVIKPISTQIFKKVYPVFYSLSVVVFYSLSVVVFYSLSLLWFSTLSVVVFLYCAAGFFFCSFKIPGREPVFSLHICYFEDPCFFKHHQVGPCFYAAKIVSLYSKGPCSFKICTSGPVFLLGFVFSHPKLQLGARVSPPGRLLRFEGPVNPSSCFFYERARVPSKQARDPAPVKEIQDHSTLSSVDHSSMYILPSLGLSNSKKKQRGTIVSPLPPPSTQSS
jgi:hypothetical protein